MNHLESYKYLRDLGFRVHVSTRLGAEGRTYSVSTFLADECKSNLAAGISCRAENSKLTTALVTAATLVRQNIDALKECSEFAGEDFFKLTIQ